MAQARSITDYIAGLPKAELHVHVQGAASVETILGLSRRHPEAGVPIDEAAMREFYTFRDFDNFIRVYLAVNRLVLTSMDVQDLVTGLGRDLAAVNVRYAEVTVTPDSHLEVGIEPDAVAEALNTGRAEVREAYGVELAYVYDINGQLGVSSGVRTVEWAERFLPDGSVGFGLGGPEVGSPRPAYADVFDRARAIGLASVPHAGETTGPQSIWDSIEALGAVRIGHGIAAAKDPALMAALVERDIVLEVCPTSNVCTGAVPSLAEHPFPVLRDAGIRLTLNTDDPGMFNTDLNAEYAIGHEVFGLDVSDLTDLAREAVRASFASQDSRARLLAEIDAYAAAHGA
jgi:aminodeoxyfutalosine deaminase